VLHPHLDRRPRPGRAVSLRPDPGPDTLPLQVGRCHAPRHRSLSCTRFCWRSRCSAFGPPTGCWARPHAWRRAITRWSSKTCSRRSPEPQPGSAPHSRRRTPDPPWRTWRPRAARSSRPATTRRFACGRPAGRTRARRLGPPWARPARPTTGRPGCCPAKAVPIPPSGGRCWSSWTRAISSWIEPGRGWRHRRPLPEEAHRSLEALLESGPRLPSHRLADPRRLDRRTPLLARTSRTMLRRLAAAGERPQDLEDGGDVRLHAGAHVEGDAFAAAERLGVGLGDVLDVDEVARLAAVPGDRRGLTGQQLPAEDGHHSRLPVRVLARPVDV